MPLNLDVGQVSDRGRVRESNEDNLSVMVSPDIAPDLDALLLVADGMGGHQAGEVASKFVTDKLTELFTSSKYREWVAYRPEREDYYVLVLKEVVERLNDQLHQMASSREEWRGMGTTATIALIAGSRLYIGHVGDSRAYLLRNGTLQQLTKDHTWVMEQIEQGLMTLDQAAADPRKNRITRSIGVSSMIRVDRTTLDLSIGDTLVLCTDGLTNLLGDAEIQNYVQTIPDPQLACQALVDTANQRGGGDNITVVVARAVSEGESRHIVAAPPVVDVAAEKNAELTTRRLQRTSRKFPDLRRAREQSRTRHAPTPPSAESLSAPPPSTAPEAVPLPASKRLSNHDMRRFLVPVAKGFVITGVIGVAAAFNAAIAFVLHVSANDGGVLLAIGVGFFTFVILALGIVLQALFLWRGKRTR